jgi:hypothetical protein
VDIDFGRAEQPKSVRIGSRVWTFAEPVERLVCPMKESEVFQGAVVKVEIRAAGEHVLIAGFTAYVIETEVTKPGREIWDWKLAGTSLRDFLDDSRVSSPNETVALIVQISGAEFWYDERDRPEVVKLLTVMYGKPEIANVCRRMVLKACGEREDLDRIWAEAIRTVCENKDVDPEMIELLWRDYALLGDEAREIVGDSIWSFAGDRTTFHSLLTRLVG